MKTQANAGRHRTPQAARRRATAFAGFTLLLAGAAPSAALADDRQAPAIAPQRQATIARPMIPIGPRDRARVLALAAACGDAVLDEGETCDDGNRSDGDGCSALCLIEDGFSCTVPQPPQAVNAVADAGFEAPVAQSPWSYGSARFGSSRCSLADCGYTFGSGPLEGEHWVWLGGAGGAADVSFAEQTLVIPSEAQTLAFELETVRCDSPADVLRVTLDGQLLFAIDGASQQCNTLGYGTVSADVSSFADDAPHKLRFEAQTMATNTMASAFMLDDVRISGALGPPIPSDCSPVPAVCLAQNFDGLAGDLAAAGWSTFSTGAAELLFSTTDAGPCQGSGWGGGNVTGGGGDAACADAGPTAGSAVESWLCSPPLTLTAAGTPALSFRGNAQGVPPLTQELLGVYVGTAPPGPATITDYASVFASPQNIGRFATLPGRTVNVELDPIAGASTGYVCFRFGGDDEWYAQVDDVAVTAVGCFPPNLDTDSDGLLDGEDNCIDRANGPAQPDAGGRVQYDVDGDGFGNACDADFDDNCFVGRADLDTMLAGIFTADPLLDLDGNGIVNIRDVAVLLRQAGGPPGPSGLASCIKRQPPAAPSRRPVRSGDAP